MDDFDYDDNVATVWTNGPSCPLNACLLSLARSLGCYAKVLDQVLVAIGSREGGLCSMMDDFDYDDNVATVWTIGPSSPLNVSLLSLANPLGCYAKALDRFWWRLDHKKGVFALSWMILTMTTMWQRFGLLVEVLH